MSKQVIQLGAAPTGVGGDTPRSANVKATSNFDELYAALGATGNPMALPAALPIEQGGTGAKTAPGALTALGIGPESSVTFNTAKANYYLVGGPTVSGTALGITIQNSSTYWEIRPLTAGQLSLFWGPQLLQYWDTSGNLKPGGDNVRTLGGPVDRYATVYSAGGVQTTSDGRLKQQQQPLSEAERAVGRRLKALLRTFKFNDDVEKHGDDGALIHTGVIAQDVKAAFEAEGLVAERYALLCFDEWEEREELRDDDGSVTRAYLPAGNRYSVRYDELLAFIISAM